MAKGKWRAEFKKFVLRGNVVDLAVGVMIGAAFQKIVTSFVNDLVMPFIGLLTGRPNFNDQFLILRLPEELPEGVTAADLTTLEAAKEVGATTFNYGAFISVVLDFLIMAVIIFMRVKVINTVHSLGKKKEVPDQLDLFTDLETLDRQRQQEEEELERERRRQKAILSIQKKYGKNALLKGMDLEEGATTRDRNGQIGGHKA